MFAAQLEAAIEQAEHLAGTAAELAVVAGLAGIAEVVEPLLAAGILGGAARQFVLEMGW